MVFDPTQHHRRTIRWKRYDYSAPGLYFVTICTHKKLPILGSISEGRMMLSPAGELVRKNWCDIPARFPTAVVDAFVVMPNHLHGVLILVRPLPRVALEKTNATKEGAASSAPTDLMPTLGKVMRAFKSVSAIEINHLFGRDGKAVWQRNYYERVIRTPRELQEIQKYIELNPLRWEYDRENPSRKNLPGEAHSKLLCEL